MNEAIFTQLQKEMDGSVSALRKELGKIRTGRASTGLLEHITVDYYGATTPLIQLATLSAPESRLLVIQPFDRGAMGEIEKAILKSDLGLTPSNDGKVIRIPIPQLTEERRKELVKHVKKIAEEYRVSVRNHRRVAIEHLKEAEKKKEITADDSKHGHERIQRITDDFISRIDKTVKAKEEEVMAV
ncbi:MAG TPA: ribosome recycling factor [Candidatus Binatia bacterium]|jgi:ribosome recycling factor|nr:ribosome recycling factor [Candidatus Binatia bacterium]